MLDLPSDDLLDPAPWRAVALPRERLRACERDLDGVTDPREAWETLAARGWIPFDAIDDPARSFHRPSGIAVWDPIERRVTYGDGPVANVPRARPFAVRLGAMWREVTQVEALAAEAVERREAWGGDSPLAGWRRRWGESAPLVWQWRYHHVPFVLHQDLHALASSLAALAPRAAARAGERLRGVLRRLPRSVRQRLTPCLLGHALLREVATSEGELVAVRSALRDPADPRPLPDPFEPHLLAFVLGGFVMGLPHGLALELFALHNPATAALSDGGYEQLATLAPWDEVRGEVAGVSERR